MSSPNGTATHTADGQRKPLSRERVQTHEEALELRDHHWPQYDAARSRIDEARKFISKETRAPVTTDFKLAGVDSQKFGAGLPQQMTTALRLRNFITSRVPALSWFAGREAGVAEEVATDLEMWGEAGMALIYPYVAASDILQNEGEAGSIMRPATAGYGKRPPPESVKVDRHGRAETDRYYKRDAGRRFEPDADRSRSAYSTKLEAYLARHFPVEAEIVSLTDAAPINPRWLGTGPKARVAVDGLIVEREYTVSELLRRRICWWENGRLIEPGGSNGGATRLRLLEEWLSDKDGYPWVTYTVSDGSRGYRTEKQSRDGTRLVEHQLDLYGEYGLMTLPVAWEYGWHFAVSDVGKRGVPFVYPFIEAFLTALTMLSGISVHTLLTGFGGWFVLKDQRTPQITMATDAVDLRSPSDQPIRIGAFEVVELEARDVKPAVHVGPSPQAGKLIEFLLQQIAEAGPPPGAFGGQAENALDRTTIMRQTEMAVGDITGGTCRLFGRSASNMLELGCALGRHFKMSIPVSANVEVPNAGSGAGAHIVLDPDDVEEIYDYTATYPSKPGDNLALAAQLWGFYSGPKQGITWDEWREWAFGDKHPEVTMGKMIADQIAMGPMGIQDVLKYVARKIADEEMGQKLEAMEDGAVSPEGTPEDMLAGVGMGPPGAGGMSGADVGAQMAAAAGAGPGGPVSNPAMSQMAGAIGAQMANANMSAAIPMSASTAPPGG